jgi:hypothetical protein
MPREPARRRTTEKETPTKVAIPLFSPIGLLLVVILLLVAVVVTSIIVQVMQGTAVEATAGLKEEGKKKDVLIPIDTFYKVTTDGRFMSYEIGIELDTEKIPDDEIDRFINTIKGLKMKYCSAVSDFFDRMSVSDPRFKSELKRKVKEIINADFPQIPEIVKNVYVVTRLVYE